MEALSPENRVMPAKKGSLLNRQTHDTGIAVKNLGVLGVLALSTCRRHLRPAPIVQPFPVP